MCNSIAIFVTHNPAEQCFQCHMTSCGAWPCISSIKDFPISTLQCLAGAAIHSLAAKGGSEECKMKRRRIKVATPYNEAGIAFADFNP